MGLAASPSDSGARPGHALAHARLAPPPVTVAGSGRWSGQASDRAEAKLFRRVALGDGEALGALYDLYAKPLYTFAIHMLNDSREAEQVLAEVFMGIWERGPSFDETVGKPSSWAVTMTRDQAMDRLRARYRLLRMAAPAGRIPNQRIPLRQAVPKSALRTR